MIEGFDLPGLTCGPEPGGPVHHNVHVALGGPGKDRPAQGTARPGGDAPALVYPGRPGLAGLDRRRIHLIEETVSLRLYDDFSLMLSFVKADDLAYSFLHI